MEILWTLWKLALFFSTARMTIFAARAVPWLEQGDYPNDYDHFVVYVTQELVPMTGEKALLEGCGRNGQPYKYRGQSHLLALRKVLQGVTEEVWVGAVATTTPWMWANDRYLYELVGFSASLPDHRVRRIPGNNVFLCSLECDNSRFVLLQGNKCGCSETPPDLLPTSGSLSTFSKNSRLRCPGTYDQICGTVSTYSVYRSMLPESVRWASLVEKQRYCGRKAFLYKQPQSVDGSLLLMAETDWTVKMGYICNGTDQEVPGKFHERHIWAKHAPESRETWRNARNTCTKNGSELLVLSPDDDISIPAVRERMEEGQSYWVALSRQNVSLWLDGTAMRETATYHQHGRTGCLLMSLRDGAPTFTFESCTGIQLQVLCEKDTRIHTRSFTHDENGNHVTATGQTVTVDSTYASTVSALIALLVILSILSIVLVVCLCNRDRCLPPKTVQNRPAKGASHTHSEPVAKDIETTPSVNVLNAGELGEKDQHILRTQPNPASKTSNSCVRDAAGYTVVIKNRLTRRPPTGCEDTASRSSPKSRSPEYTEMCISDGAADCKLKQDHISENEKFQNEKFYDQVHQDQKLVQDQMFQDKRFQDMKFQSQKFQDDLNNRRYRAATLRAESKDTLTGSEDTTYSVLSYRRAIQKAWVGLKRTAAYAHVIVRRPKKSESEDTSHTETDDVVGVYDVTQPVAPRVPCIDNVYDHTEPQIKANITDSGYDPRKKKRAKIESVV